MGVVSFCLLQNGDIWVSLKRMRGAGTFPGKEGPAKAKALRGHMPAKALRGHMPAQFQEEQRGLCV